MPFGWRSDQRYEIDEPMALYGAIPIIWAIHRLGGKTMASGFLWINPSDRGVRQLLPPKVGGQEGNHEKNGFS